LLLLLLLLRPAADEPRPLLLVLLAAADPLPACGLGFDIAIQLNAWSSLAMDCKG
jgi:hypothetical protein